MSIKTVLLADIIVTGVAITANALFAIFTGARKETRVPIIAILMWFAGFLGTLTNYHGLQLAWARPMAFAIEAAFVAGLIALSIKTTPSAYFGGKLILVLSLLMQALASYTTDTPFERGLIITAAALLGVAALIFMMSWRREGIVSMISYGGAVLFYLVLLGLLIYGPNVTDNGITPFGWQLGMTITRTVGYTILNVFTAIDYQPAQAGNTKLADWPDWLSYFFATGQVAPLAQE